MKRSISLFGILAIVLWLSLPTAVFADNCQNMGADERDRECSIPEKVLGFFTGLGIMAGIFSKYHNPKPTKKNQLSQWGQAAAPKPPPKTPEAPPPFWDPRGWF